MDDDRIARELSAIGSEEPPVGFHERVMARVAAERGKPAPSGIWGLSGFYIPAAACFLAGLLFVGGSVALSGRYSSDAPRVAAGETPAVISGGDLTVTAKSGVSAPPDAEPEYGMEAEDASDGFAVNYMAARVAPADEGLVIRHRLTVVVDDTRAAVESLGGYGEFMVSMSESADRAEASYRPPRADAPAVVDAIKSLGVVREDSIDEYSVAGDRIDANARIASRQIELENMRALLGRTATVADMLTLTIRVDQILSDMDAANSQLSLCDYDVGYPAVSVTFVASPKAYEPPPEKSFGAKVSDAFVSGANGTGTVIARIAYALAALAVPLVVIAVIAAAVVITVKLAGRGRK
ncbi:MAG: DUF4349 domain-containing protein [Clostridiales bacterium]|jgi:hypothetical protein|nr:DUF4349 domain-containing protein [Clostridiales bacterium]